MQLCTTPALKGTAFIAVHFMLPADTPHCLLLQWRERKKLSTHSAERVMVVIEDPLVTVFVADVSGSSEFATVHVPKNVLVLAPLVTLVTRVWPFCVKDCRQENHIAGLSNHRFAKYLHCTAARKLFTGPFHFLRTEFSATQNKNLLQSSVWELVKWPQCAISLCYCWANSSE